MAKRIMVIGAGVVGICCAISLQKDGHDVVVIDTGLPGEATSKGNAGVIANNMRIPLATPDTLKQLPEMLLNPRAPLRIAWPYLPSLTPWLVRFALAARPTRVASAAKALSSILQEALPAYHTLLDDVGAPELLRHQGWLMVYRDARRFDAAHPRVEEQRQYGVRVDPMSKAEVAALQPDLSDDIQGAFMYPDCAHVNDPLVLVRKLAGAFAERGGCLNPARARSIGRLSGGTLRVRTEQEDYEVDAVVVAAGIWSRDLAASIGARVPLESERGYSLTIPAPGVALNGPILSGDHFAGVTPMGTRLRVAGTVELASRDARPNYGRADMLADAVQALFPRVDISDAEKWMGHRPSTPDSLPVLGESQACPGVYFAFGHGHLGVTLAAVTGRITADLASGREPEIDVTPFRAERFHA